MLSSHQYNITDPFNICVGNVRKLVSNFFDKERYALQYENLDLCFRLVLKLKKIHHVLEFSQSLLLN